MDAKTQDAFVPMFDPPHAGKQSARVGWVVAENGCHLWQGARSSVGYGQVWVNGRHHAAHRVRYEREVGPIPDGMHLDHFVCEDKACCNPGHVRPVTNRENVLRGNAPPSANASKTHCIHGHLLAGGNLYVEPPTGGRRCKECRRAKHRRLYHARRAALSTGGRDADK